MTYQYIYQNIGHFCGKDDMATKSLIEIIKISLMQSLKELQTYSISENKVQIANLAHKLKTTFIMMGDADMVKKNKILNDAVYENMSEKQIENLFSDYVKSIDNLTIILDS